jgi:hypothetical protein
MSSPLAGLPIPPDVFTDGPTTLTAADWNERVIDPIRDAMNWLDGDDEWITPNLESGWQQYGSTYQRCTYRRAAGIVYLQGLIRSGTGTGIRNPIFVLPEGYRPEGQLYFACPNQDRSVAVIAVAPAGQVFIYGYYGGATAGGGVGLDVISFFVQEVS